MTTTVILILLVLIVGYAAYSIPVMFEFRSYCERVAKATNRCDELNDQRCIDDGGNNAFEREQSWRLLRGDFGNLNDPALAAEAASLSRKIRLSFFLAVGFICGIAIIFFGLMWLSRLELQ